MKTFKELKIGDTFITGKIENTGHSKILGGYAFIIYKKNSKSKAIAVAQYGYGNKRSVGHNYNFAPNKVVFEK